MGTSKFNPMDWDIETELETGNDDFVYGNYVDWDDFRNHEEENLMDSFNVNLPWDEKLTWDEYYAFIHQEVFQKTSIINEWELDNLKIIGESSTMSGLLLKFPSRQDSQSHDIVSSILDYYEVPSGTDYEYDLPEHLQFWQQDVFDNQYSYYKERPLEFTQYKEIIDDITKIAKRSPDTMTKKALLLSSFILSESLLKSVITDNIPSNENFDHVNKNLLDNLIDKKLRNTAGRNELFKAIFDKKVPDMEWIDLRNVLAHDIANPRIDGERITYEKNKSDGYKQFEINELFKKQKNFCYELETIRDTYMKNVPNE